MTNKGYEGAAYVGSSINQKLDENLYQPYPKVNDFKNNSYDFLGRVGSSVASTTTSAFSKLKDYAYSKHEPDTIVYGSSTN